MYFLCVDKPEGYTSHDIITLLRVITGIRRIGHTGTLDPFATGVLLLAFQDATRLMAYLPQRLKQYQCIVQLGVMTETEDCTGSVVTSKEVPLDFRRKIEAQFQNFTGNIQQQPPIYSAIKVNGRRLYEYARKGESVEIPKREIHIESIQYCDSVFGRSPIGNQVALNILCSKGTYVRTLGSDISKSIGTVGHVLALRRLASDGVGISTALTLPKLAELLIGKAESDWRLVLSKDGRTQFARCSREEMLERLKPFRLQVETIFDGSPTLNLSDDEALWMSRGKALESVLARLPTGDLIQLLWKGKQMAILRADGSIARVNPSIAAMRTEWQEPTKQ